jgi:hypothetical protein
VSPLRLDRHGVTVPFRVLLDSEVARLSGSSLPARPWHPQNAWPTRYSVHRPCSRTRLLEHSSPGVRTSFTVLPKPLPTTSRSGAPLLGFFAPSAHKEERVHVLRVAPDEADGCPAATSSLAWKPPGCPGSLARPTLPASVPLTGFLNLSAVLFLSPPSRHISGRWHSWGSHPPGVCSFHEAPATRHRRHTFMTFFLQIGQGPRPREGPSAGALCRCLGSQPQCHYRLQGLQPRGSRSAPWNRISVSIGRPAPHGLQPPHGLNRG